MWYAIVILEESVEAMRISHVILDESVDVILDESVVPFVTFPTSEEPLSRFHVVAKISSQRGTNTSSIASNGQELLA